ncbi:hypothetical protein TH61_01895 [Rufibacter sp. DG15C]|uniref:hypothetical protein n=1 Tax=Rufibacter sp. DG15C TaxID=1379909 RepID=UPI00078E90C1|nr:hypothetical protein [Rufibacter sp. DG15C]AMM50174.1 hypothetical protein TH61_01895 [Rufibacter sp. DG15C]
MENFKIGQYLGIIAVVQFVVTLGLGVFSEAGDMGVAWLYPLDYLLVAVFLNYVYGLLLQLFTPKLPGGGFWLLWLILGTGLMLANELFIQGATQMLHVILLAAAALNALYFYKDLGRKKPAFTKSS